MGPLTSLQVRGSLKKVEEPAPPESAPGADPAHQARTFGLLLGIPLLGLCLWITGGAVLQDNAEHAIQGAWSEPTRELAERIESFPAAVPGTAESTLELRGPILPIRQEAAAMNAPRSAPRIDLRVFLALPPEWQPPQDRAVEPALALLLRYRDAEVRVYGQTARGGAQTRRRQVCLVKVYDLEKSMQVAELELESPDPLPEGYRDEARLNVEPAQIFAALREL